MSLLLKGLILGAALALISVLGLKLNILPFRLGFLALALAVLIMFLVALLSLLGLLLPVGWMQHASKASAALAVVVGLSPVLLILLAVGPSNFKVPPIHDISTDLADVPEFVKAQQLRGDGANSVETPDAHVRQQQAKAYGDLRTLNSTLSFEAAHARAEQVAAEMGWTIHHSDKSAGRIEAYDKTSFLGFTDDIVIRIRPSASGSIIDMRSVSRVGKSDLGANAARIREFIQRYEGRIHS